MIVVGFGIGMATQAIEDGKIGRIGVALGTLIPFVFVLAAVNREIHAVVIKIGRHPGGFIVTILASRRETRYRVVGIVGLGIIRLVATIAGIRDRIVVVIDVAGVTIE